MPKLSRNPGELPRSPGKSISVPLRGQRAGGHGQRHRARVCRPRHRARRDVNGNARRKRYRPTLSVSRHCDAYRCLRRCDFDNMETGNEGDVSAFELPRDAAPITVEAPTGRMMAIAPGDMFLATPSDVQRPARSPGAFRPAGSFRATTTGCSPLPRSGGRAGRARLRTGIIRGRIRYLGAVYGDRGERLNIRQFALTGSVETDRNGSVSFYQCRNSGEAGKTTAGVAVLRARCA